MRTSFKLQFQFEGGYSAKDLPLTRAECARAVSEIRVRVRDEREWIESTAILGGEPRTLSFLICDDETIRRYNRRFRSLDRATDVLSFPTRESGEGWSPHHGSDGFDIHLGDVIVSLETVARAAKRARRKTREEFLEVLIHGCLHLLGFDHIGNGAAARVKAKRMMSLQRELYRGCRRFI